MGLSRMSPNSVEIWLYKKKLLMSVEIVQLVKCLLYKCKDPGNPIDM